MAVLERNSPPGSCTRRMTPELMVEFRMHSFADHPLSLSGATPFMIKREIDRISIALFGSVYVAIKACIEPLPDDGEIDTGLTLCACTAAKAFNPINKTATKRLSLKAVRECVRSRGSRSRGS